MPRGGANLSVDRLDTPAALRRRAVRHLIRVVVTTMPGAMLVASLSGGGALGQQTATPDIYAQPPYGYGSTADPAGNSTMAPSTYGGGPDYGVATRGDDGQICVTTPGLIGKPQYGTTTTCYSDAAELHGRDVEKPWEATGRR